jgi:putative transposase
MKVAGLKSVCRKKKYNYIKSTPEVTAENVMNQNFKIEHTCEK